MLQHLKSFYPAGLWIYLLSLPLLRLVTLVPFRKYIHHQHARSSDLLLYSFDTEALRAKPQNCCLDSSSFSIAVQCELNLIDVQLAEGALNAEQSVGIKPLARTQLLIDAKLIVFLQVIIIVEHLLLHLGDDISYTTILAATILRQILTRYHIIKLLPVFVYVELKGETREIYYICICLVDIIFIERKYDKALVTVRYYH